MHLLPGLLQAVLRGWGITTIPQSPAPMRQIGMFCTRGFLCVRMSMAILRQCSPDASEVPAPSSSGTKVHYFFLVTSHWVFQSVKSLDFTLNNMP
jgi:hypothetical protein